jgi:sugar/nucleoside kinase (ribokinase family)
MRNSQISRIVVVGSSNTDMIIKAAKIPRPGETILGGEFLMAAGGKGANQAVAATRAGSRVTLVARVGDDMFGAWAVSLSEGRPLPDAARFANAAAAISVTRLGAQPSAPFRREIEDFLKKRNR